MVEVQLVTQKKDVAFAKVQKYITRGPGTIEPPCPSFGPPFFCGGCDWLNLSYETQLKYKTELVREQIQSLNPGIDIPETIASPVTQYYRNKAFMPVGKGKNGLEFGIYERWSHKIVPHKTCFLHPPEFDLIAHRCLELMDNAKVQPYDETSHTGTLRHIGFRCSKDKKQILMILVTRSAKLPFSNLLVKKLTSEFPQLSGIVQNINREKGNVILGNDEKILYGNPYINEEINNLKFRIHYKSFWQVNSAMLQLIIKNINGKVQPEDTVLDTFSGIGVLGLSLAAKVREVFCIEESYDAIEDGKFNCQLNNISNVTFLNGKTEDTLPVILNSPEKYTSKIPEVIILDPPRTGVQKSVLEEIIKAQLSHILYLSCSPITLRRDLNILLESGLYEIISIQPFDMFPQTWHIETLVELKYKK